MLIYTFCVVNILINLEKPCFWVQFLMFFYTGGNLLCCIICNTETFQQICYKYICHVLKNFQTTLSVWYLEGFSQFTTTSINKQLEQVLASLLNNYNKQAQGFFCRKIFTQRYILYISTNWSLSEIYQILCHCYIFVLSILYSQFVFWTKIFHSIFVVTHEFVQTCYTISNEFCLSHPSWNSLQIVTKGTKRVNNLTLHVADDISGKSLLLRINA